MSAALCTAREQTARIARLNDLARSAMGVACTAVATVGFRSLPEADQSSVRELIETYDAFDDDNDPHGERDFGTMSANGYSGNSTVTTAISGLAARMRQTPPLRGAS